jgi:hypothetical protein
VGWSAARAERGDNDDVTLSLRPSGVEDCAGAEIDVTVTVSGHGPEGGEEGAELEQLAGNGPVRSPCNPFRLAERTWTTSCTGPPSGYPRPIFQPCYP